MKFTIITPNYKSRDKLIRAHNSLLSNTTSFEHIIIDDYSQDDSLQNLVSQESSKNFIPIWLNANSGPGNARNIGLEKAQGDYVIFLDADDYFEENALDILLEIIEKNDNPDLITFDYSMMKNYSMLSSSINDGSFVELDNTELIKQFLLDNIISSPWCKCIKASIAKQNIFPNLRVQQDSLYNFSTFLLCKHNINFNKVLYCFDKSFTGSLTTKPFTKQEMLKFYKSWMAFEFLVKKSTISEKHDLLSIRKIKFCTFYYINRLADGNADEQDPFIVGVIKKTFVQNYQQAKSYLSFKGKLIGVLFLISPKLTVSLVRHLK